MLGGSMAQVTAIKKAKEMGHYVILCDYLEDNPGQNYADEFHLVSTTDKEAVLDLAREKNIDGIVAYASDPAAPTAAYVGNKLGLPSNPYDSVKKLCRKDLFRNFLKENDFNTPKSDSFTNFIEAKKYFKKIKRPMVLKPLDSSGSKGVAITKNSSDIKEHFEKAKDFSRVDGIILEEKIDHAYDYILGGDGFVVDGKLKFHCFFNCYRGNNGDSLIPLGKIYPHSFDEKIIRKVEEEIQKAIDILKLKNGALNIEILIDENEEIYILEIGPRNGGNLMPDLIKHITGQDLIKCTIDAAIGNDLSDLKMNYSNGYYGSFNLNYDKSGILDKIQFSSILKDKIFDKLLYVESGDEIERFDGANKALGIIMMEFKTEEEMYDIYKNMNEHIKVLVK